MPALLGLIDSHAHLADAAFDHDRTEVIARAQGAGVCGIVCIGASLAAAGRSREIATAHPGVVWFTAGIHPHDASDFDHARDVGGITELLAAGAVAIGECGLDYHYDHSPPALQRRAFAAQLALARETGRPVIVHSRDAEADTRAMISEAGSAGTRGVLHCFTGSVGLAECALAEGWYVSFSGIITFKSWVDEALLRVVPNDRILVESDAPYLAPVPNRGKRNEPAFVAQTLGRLAEARRMGPDATDLPGLGALVAMNARRLFGLFEPPGATVPQH